MSLKGKVEAIIYAAEEPVTVEQIATLLKDIVLAEMAQDSANAAAALEESARGQSDAATEETPALSPSAGDKDGAPETAPETEAESNPQTPSEVTGEAAVEADASAEVAAPEATSKKKAPKDPELTAVKAKLRTVLAELVADYQSEARGIEIRQIAGGYRMATKPEHHDVVVGFAKSLKPPIRLSLQALETLAVIAYKQPVTGPEISEIRGVDSSGVLASLISRKLITTAGRKQVIGRPILYKTTKDFLMRFGLKDISELPSIEEFEKLTAAQNDLFEASEGGVADATGVPDAPEQASEQSDAQGHYEENTIETPRASNE